MDNRTRPRQRRFQAAKDQTAVTVAQTTDNERTLTFNVASQFIAALLAQANIELADTDLKSFQETVDIAEEQTKLGSMSGGDLLKIKLQLLQFQTDVSAARLARIQALAGLRQLLGYDSVPENFEVVGDLEYKPVKLGKDELKAMALRRPVISTYIAGIPELVRPNEDGWLVPAGDIESLASAIRNCLDAPEGTLASMGEAARKRVLARHDSDIEATKLAALISQTVEGRG